MVFSLLDTGNPNFPIVTPKDPPLPSMDAPKQHAASADDEVLGRVWHLARPLLRAVLSRGQAIQGVIPVADNDASMHA